MAFSVLEFVLWVLHVHVAAPRLLLDTLDTELTYPAGLIRR
jgi:hypothetical protein